LRIAPDGIRRCARRRLICGTGVSFQDGGRMLKLALFFFIISIIAAVFGFTGIAAAAAGIAKILFFIFIVIFVILLIVGLAIGSALF
jgi:uncharacterized membrane protein YtjA (UPF0391 family)